MGTIWKWWIRLPIYVLLTGAVVVATTSVSAWLIDCVADCTNELAALSYGFAAFWVCVIAAALVEIGLYRSRRVR